MSDVEARTSSDIARSTSVSSATRAQGGWIPCKCRPWQRGGHSADRLPTFAPPAEQESRSALRHRHEHAKHAHDMHWRMSARAGCRVRYKLRPLAPIVASPRALCHPRAPAVRRLLMRANPRNALLLSASADLHGSFNGDSRGGCSSPELRSGPVKVKSAAVARAFAQRLLFFSG